MIKDTNSQATLARIAAVEKEVEKKVEKILKDQPRGLGFCHIYWRTKKRVLSEDYGIEWLTPQECNPGVMFD